MSFIRTSDGWERTRKRIAWILLGPLFILSAGVVVYGAPGTFVLTASPTAGNVDAGGSVTYTVTAANSPGAADVTATVVDSDPSHFTSVITNPVTPPAIHVPASGSVVFTVVVTAAANAEYLSTNTTTFTLFADRGSGPIETNTIDIVTTVNPGPAIALSKTVDGQPVSSTAVIGDTVEYAISYENTDPSIVRGFTVTDTVDNRLTIDSVGSGGVVNGSQIVWSIGDLSAGTTGTVTFTATLENVPNQTSIPNVATGKGSNIAAGDSNTVTLVAQAPELQLSKSVSTTSDPTGASAQPGDTIVFTIGYRNSGDADLNNFNITDTVDADVSVTAVSAPGSLSGSTASWSLGTLSPSLVTQTVTITGIVKTVPDGTSITNTATGAGDELPAGSTNMTITVVNGVADLVLTKDAPSFVTAGTSFVYTIGVTNTGPNDNAGFSVTDTVPAGLTFVSASPSCSFSAGTVTCSSSGLPLLDSVEFEVTVTVGATVPTGTVISNTAVIASTATSDPTPNNSATASTTVVAEADLGLTKTNAPDPAIAGETLVYTLSVTNDGPSSNAGYQVSDPLPSEVVFVSASPSCAVALGTVTCGSAGLNVGATQVFTVTVTVLPSTATGTVISNTATIQGNSTPDPDPLDDSSISTATVSTSADLDVTKTGSVDPVIAGEQLTYDIVVSNLGPSDNAGFQVADTLPSGVSLLAASPSADCSGSTTITCGQTNLAAGASVTYTVTVTVDSGYTSPTISNTASISSNATADPRSSNDTDTVVTQVTTQADLRITKTDSPDPVTAGTDLTYLLTVTNLGPSDNAGFDVTDTVPSGTTLVSADAACTQPPATSITCSSAGLTNGDSVTYTVTVHVSPSFIGASIANTASIAATQTTDPDASNDSSTVTTTVVSSADLALTKVDTPDPVAAGSLITYTVQVANNGPSDSGSFSIVDVVPSGTTFSSASAGCTEISGVITCTVPSLGFGSTTTMTISVLVDPGVSAGSVITNTASIGTSSTSDPDASNDSAIATTSVIESVGLFISKSSSPATVNAGEQVTYSVVVTNGGPSNADSTTVVDLLPSGLSAVSASPGCSGTTSITCNLGTLAPGQQVTVTVTALVDPAAPAGTVTNIATVDSAEPEGPVTATADTVITRSADLSITKIDTPDPVDPADQIIYSIVVTNNGPSTSDRFQIEDSVPSNTSFVTATANDCVESAGLITCTSSGLASGASVTFTVVVLVDPGTSDGTVISNTADITSATTPDPVSSNDSATATTTVSAPDLSLTKTASPASGSNVSPGQVITFTISYINNGSGSASGFVVTDTVDTMLGGVVVSNGGTFDPISRVITWSIGTLPAGATGSVSFTATPGSSATPKQITNEASAIATELAASVASNQTTHRLTPPNLLVTKTADRAEDSQVKAFAVITYTLLAENKSQGAAFNTSISDNPPPYLNYVPGSTTLDGAAVGDVGGSSPVFGSGLSLGTLASGDSRTVTFKMTVDPSAKAGALLENGATLACSLCTASSVDFFRLIVFKPTSGPSLRQSILVEGASGSVLFVMVFNEVFARVVDFSGKTGIELVLGILLALSAIGFGRALSLRMFADDPRKRR